MVVKHQKAKPRRMGRSTERQTHVLIGIPHKHWVILWVLAVRITGPKISKGNPQKGALCCWCPFKPTPENNMTSLENIVHTPGLLLVKGLIENEKKKYRNGTGHCRPWLAQVHFQMFSKEHERRRD